MAKSEKVVCQLCGNKGRDVYGRVCYWCSGYGMVRGNPWEMDHEDRIEELEGKVAHLDSLLGSVLKLLEHQSK